MGSSDLLLDGPEVRSKPLEADRTLFVLLAMGPSVGGAWGTDESADDPVAEMPIVASAAAAVVVSSTTTYISVDGSFSWYLIVGPAVVSLPVCSTPPLLLLLLLLLMFVLMLLLLFLLLLSLSFIVFNNRHETNGSCTNASRVATKLSLFSLSTDITFSHVDR